MDLCVLFYSLVVTGGYLICGVKKQMQLGCFALFEADSWLLAKFPGSSWLVLTLDYEVTRQSTVSWALIGSRFNLSPDSSEKFISGPLTLCCQCFFTHSPLNSRNVIHFVWSLVIVFSVQTASLLPQLNTIWPFSSDFLTSTSHFHPDILLLIGSFLFFRKFSVNSRDCCVGKYQQFLKYSETVVQLLLVPTTMPHSNLLKPAFFLTWKGQEQHSCPFSAVNLYPYLRFFSSSNSLVKVNFIPHTACLGQAINSHTASIWISVLAFHLHDL